MKNVDTLATGAGSSANQDKFPFEPRGVQNQADGERIAPVAPSTFLKTPKEVAADLATSPLEETKRRVQAALAEGDEGKGGFLGRVKAVIGGMRGR